MRRYTPWKRLYNATAYSLRGLFQAFRQEQAFEYEAVVFFFLCALLLHLIDAFAKVFEMSLNGFEESENRIGSGRALLCGEGQLGFAFSGCLQLLGEICVLG